MKSACLFTLERKLSNKAHNAVCYAPSHSNAEANYDNAELCKSPMAGSLRPSKKREKCKQKIRMERKIFRIIMNKFTM